MIVKRSLNFIFYIIICRWGGDFGEGKCESGRLFTSKSVKTMQLRNKDKHKKFNARLAKMNKSRKENKEQFVKF